MINDKFIKKFLGIDENCIKNEVNNKTEETKKENIINTIVLDSSKISYFKLSSFFNQIECLSLRDNFIRDISFLHYLPSIYYLDLYGNHLDNYKPLVKHGTFGFLSLSPPKNYFEKKILTLTQINVIIFEVDITDKSIYNNLIVGNPNILVFNDSIIDFNKKVRIFNTVMGLRFYIHHLLSDNEEMKMLKKSNQNYKNIKNKNKNDSHSLRDMLLEKKFKIKHRNMTNPKCSEIINFFDGYNKVLFDMFKDHKSKFNNETLMNEERKKILMIYKTLNQIGKYFSFAPKNFSKLMKDNKEMLTKKIEFHSIKYPNIDIDIFSNLEFAQYKELVLSVIILYLLKIFSKDISYYLILLMFRKTKYFHESQKNKTKIKENIELLFNINKSYLFCYYYKIFDILFGKSENIMNMGNLYNVKNRLNMISITDKISEILINQEILVKDYNLNENISQKNKIILKDFIGFLFHLKIFPAIFNIFQFVNDFIIFNKLYNHLEKNFFKDIHFFCEILGLLLNNYNKFNEINESIADKNYDKILNKFLLGNKFYFKKAYSKERRIPYSIPQHKIFHPNKKKILELENIKPLHEVRKEREQSMKQNYINNALKKYLIIKKERKSENNAKTEINNKSTNEYKNYNRTDDNIEKKFYRTFNFDLNKNNTINDINKDNSKEKMKTFYNSNTLKSSKSNSRKINNLKTLSILTDYSKRNTKFFNNYLLSNQFNSFRNDFNQYTSNLTEFFKKNNKQENEQNNLVSSLDSKDEYEKEIKQFSISFGKNIRNKYSVREFKKGYIISSYYNMDNDSKYENIKTSFDSMNPKKYHRTPKFSSLFL